MKEHLKVAGLCAAFATVGFVIVLAVRDNLPKQSFRFVK